MTEIGLARIAELATRRCRQAEIEQHERRVRTFDEGERLRAAAGLERRDFSPYEARSRMP